MKKLHSEGPKEDIFRGKLHHEVVGEGIELRLNQVLRLYPQIILQESIPVPGADFGAGEHILDVYTNSSKVNPARSGIWHLILVSQYCSDVLLVLLFIAQPDN